MTTIHVEREKTDRGGRYVVTLPGIAEEAELTWVNAGDGIIIADHTYSPDSMRGKGVASALVQQLVADARAEGIKIVPLCPFVGAQFASHPEWADLRA